MADKRKNIMIVDDDEDLRRELSEIMDSENYQVKSFADGREALGEIQRFHPNVLLLDIRMPKINGIQMLDWLRCKNLVNGLKIIIITGFYDEQKCKKIAQVYGVNAYMLKPFDPEELLDKVEAVIAKG